MSPQWKGTDTFRENWRFEYQTSATGRIDGVRETTSGPFRTFAYDLTDRLRGVTPPGQSQIGYNYDPAGNRTREDMEGDKYVPGGRALVTIFSQSVSGMISRLEE